jgi:gas vesicle protein
MSSDNADRTAYVTLGVLFGMAAGIGAGMLMAPRSGEETRRQIRDRARDAKQRSQAQLIAKRDATTHKLASTLDASKGLIDKASDKAHHAVDKTATRAHEAADRAQIETETNPFAS